METAEELFNKHKYETVIQYDCTELDVMEYLHFKDALKEHDKEIVKMIEPVIILTKELIECDIPKESCDRCENFTKVYEALTELKNKIK